MMIDEPPFVFDRCRGHVFSLPPGAASSRWPPSARNWHSRAGGSGGTYGGHFWRTDNIRFANRIRLINRSFRPKTFCSNIQRQTGTSPFRRNLGTQLRGRRYEIRLFRIKIPITCTCLAALQKEKFLLVTNYRELVKSDTDRQTKCV